jgi:hypothetical protein
MGHHHLLVPQGFSGSNIMTGFVPTMRRSNFPYGTWKPRTFCGDKQNGKFIELINWDFPANQH